MAFTVADLKYIEPSVLREWILKRDEKFPFLIIDVRDSDYVGGHIKGSKNIPSAQVKHELPNIYDTLKEINCKSIVFHCTLSQQRGPSSAMMLLRYLNAVIESSKSSSDEIKFAKSINVYVLRGGFARWQNIYGGDEELTEDYDKKFWTNEF
ncbi:hypothetical protein BRETT_000106 [Brettanomyces bruxellensis]|mgnify:FL=1|uniref:Rhodanese domain-containing protein n=1 Tax=Dekkera bruxellensis TaxID=5007 RepID=A0A871R8D3_DEKBR|nr:uncharacterized protein BRETT_000106 [Brettanomyces bruxellensis]QOU18380.1 hypothetical protein BRETT_000106 [Brettanomyces bruxellensis]